MQAESSPGWLPLLPVVCLQESHLRYVRKEADEHKELQTVSYIGMKMNIGFSVFAGFFFTF